MMKYFNIKADETNLADVEKLGDDITRLQDAVYNLQQVSITKSVNPPAFILKHYADEFMKHRSRAVADHRSVPRVRL